MTSATWGGEGVGSSLPLWRVRALSGPIQEMRFPYTSDLMSVNWYKVNVRCRGISFLIDISFLVWAHDHLIKIINFYFLIPSIKLPIPRSALKVHEHLSTIIKLSIPRFSNKIANSSHGPESAPAVHKSRNRCFAFSQSLSHKSPEGSGNTRMHST